MKTSGKRVSRRPIRRAKNLRRRQPTVKMVSRIVKRSLYRSLETQDATSRNVDVLCGTLGSSNWSLGNQIYSITPNATTNNGISITQGDGEANRSANRIRLTQTSFRMCVTIQPYDAITNPILKPCIFKYWVVTAKPNFNYRLLTDVQSTSTDLFDAGNSSTGTTSAVYDLMMPFNKDKYNILETKHFKIGLSQAPVGSSATQPAWGFQSNNDSKLFLIKKLNLTKYCPKTIIYNDNTGEPSSKNVWLFFACYFQDGTTMGADIVPLRVRINQSIKFKDV